MRVRQWAVVGAALVATWAGGTGIASATDDTTPVESGPGCEAPLPVVVDGEASADTFTAGEGEGTYDGEDEGGPISSEPCGTDVWVDVLPDGDCLDPETFTFVVNAEGLEAGITYTLLLGSDDIDFTYPDGQPVFLEDIKADAQGDVVDHTFTETEGADFTAPSTGLSLKFALVEGFDTEDVAFVGFGEAELGACETEPAAPTTPAEPTHPAAAPTAPATTVAPVVATHPAAAQPAVLANTGAPVTTAALVGGGMLVVGAGALVATRRRAS